MLNLKSELALRFEGPRRATEGRPLSSQTLNGVVHSYYFFVPVIYYTTKDQLVQKKESLKQEGSKWVVHSPSLLFSFFLKFPIFSSSSLRVKVPASNPIMSVKTVHAWDIDSQGNDCSIEVIKTEVPLVWHPYRILLRVLQRHQHI